MTEKVENWAVGKTYSSDDFTLEEKIAIFGEPLAKELQKAFENPVQCDSKEMQVVAVDRERGIVTIGEIK